MGTGADHFAPDFSASLLGGGLSPEAERHLQLAAENYRFGDVAEAHLRDAETLAPGHAAVLIGLYRFYFYKGLLPQALGLARQCLLKAAQELNLPADWREVRPGMAQFDSYAEIGPRFLLFSLKGYAYLHMRLGDLAEGRRALTKILELDPSDKLGAQVLLNVIARTEAPADD
jgi:tetratricopeptide (TPR) repeat protein